MGFFDRFKPQHPQRAPLPELKLAHKPGTLYYLRARNLYSGFDDVLCFEDESSRTHYIEYGRMSTPRPSDWYFTCWEESADERAQSALADQRKALLESFTEDKRVLEHRLRAALQKYNDSKDSIAQLQKQVESLTYDYKEYKYKYEQVQDWESKYNDIASRYNFIIDAINAKRKAPAAPVNTKSILQDIANQSKDILTCIDSSKLDRIASKHKEQLAKLDKLRMPLQGKLVLALIEHEINKI